MSEKKQNFLQGTAMLAMATAIVKVIGALYKIPLNAIIGKQAFYSFGRIPAEPLCAQQQQKIHQYADEHHRSHLSTPCLSGVSINPPDKKSRRLLQRAFLQVLPQGDGISTPASLKTKKAAADSIGCRFILSRYSSAPGGRSFLP